MIENIKNKNIYKIKYINDELKHEMNYEMENEINVINIGWLILSFWGLLKSENISKLIF